MSLFLPTYFSPIIQYLAIVRSEHIIFETEDNFQKQTYRNRCYIQSAQGKQLLNVPIKHTKGIKSKTRDVQIDYKEDWVKLHLKSLETAYNASPYFEFYIDDLRDLMENRFKFLIDLNFSCHHFVMDCLQEQIACSKTTTYEKEPLIKDYRNLAVAKNEPKYQLQRYIQVFETKQGFMPNLSILDLIFMEGPNALNYLEQQKIVM